MRIWAGDTTFERTPMAMNSCDSTLDSIRTAAFETA